MVKVLFFAQLQERIGTSELTLNVENVTVSELKKRLEQEYSLTFEDFIMTAVNEEYAYHETIVHNGDTVAFIPPVSGG